MQDAKSARLRGRTSTRHRIVPNYMLGFLIFVISPAVFWSLLAFVICRPYGPALAIELPLAIFAATSAFLSAISATLRIRI